MKRPYKYFQMNTYPKYLIPALLATAILLGSCRKQSVEETVEERIPVKTQIVTEHLVIMPIRSSGKLF